MEILQRIMLIVFASLLAGCTSVPPPDTASGNPELILINVKFDCVRSAFMNSYMNQGYTIRNASDTQLVAGRTTTNNSAFWYRTFYGGPAEERITILFFPQAAPDTLRVVSTATYVSDPGTASEKVFDADGTEEDQTQLMAVKSLIERQCRK